MNTVKRVLMVLCAGGLLTAFYARLNPPAVMADSAKALLSSLSAQPRSRASFDFSHTEERLNWHFIPRERKGLALREMTSDQKQLAHALLAAGLSQQGVIKAHTI